MDFSWSEEQLAFRQRVMEFAQKELNNDVINRDHEGMFDREGWDKCAAFGIQQMATPSPYSDTPALDILSGVLAMEGLGYGCRDNGLTLGLNAHVWTAQLPILHHGSEHQKQKYLPEMAQGKLIGAHAMTEPDYGSDAYNMKTYARKVDGGYLLNGRKTLITFAPIADVFILFATINPELGKWGVTAFILECEWDGFKALPTQNKMGLRTIPFGDIVLEDCFVPEANRLGPEGAGVALSSSGLEYERCCILASQLGGMEYQLERSIDYALKRHQSGQPIGKFQSVSNRIADMKMRLETARLMLYKVAWMKKQGQTAAMESAILKLYLSEQFVDSSLDVIRIHGGVGYVTETGVERDLRDAVGGVILAGTSDIHRNIIAGLLGL